jgi:hypothetical protein
MPYVHYLKCRVGGRRVSSCFHTRQTECAGTLDIPLYRQLDGHSCGFLAALAVVCYFEPLTPPVDVLRSVAPSPVWGCGWRDIKRGLKHGGVTPAWHDRLGPRTLRRLIAGKMPVIVTLFPDGYLCDHWTVIRGLDLRSRRVFLTNPGEVPADPDGSMTWTEFSAAWRPRGAGWVCE